MTATANPRSTQRLTIGDGRGWHFVNGPWGQNATGAPTLSDEVRASDGDALQGLHFAFRGRRGPCYRDLRARFEFRLYPHTDAGIIFRGRDESRFYLLHFPNCGQACRAQHFWAALSRMDGDGFLRLVKLELVRRVPSNIGLWLAADVMIAGDRLTARIGEHGLFEASLDAPADAGAVGLYLFSRAELRNVEVEGTPVAGTAFDEGPRQPTNWFHPRPETKYGKWQRPLDLLRLPESAGDGGELLLNYTVQERAYEGEVRALLTRSRDGGRTWAEAEPLPLWKTVNDNQWMQPRLHLTPRGRLLAFMPDQEHFLAAESPDGGRTWSSPAPTNLPTRTAHVPRLDMGPAGPLNLADGSVLVFLYGGHDLKYPDTNIWTWGSIHCQAFATRSTDDGRTWSPLVNVDNPGLDREGKPIDGNLDLTEVCGAQMSDGRILGLIRPCYSPWMWETWSADGGRTWGPCVRGPFPGYATPNMLRTASGRLLVAHRLPCLTIHFSPDEGRTWDQGTLIDGGLWAMGGMLEVEPDVVLYAYWDSFESLMRMQFLRVTERGIEPVRREEWAASSGVRSVAAAR